MYHRFLGDAWTVEYPRGSGRQAHLGEVADDIAARLASIFLTGAGGVRPVVAGIKLYTRPDLADAIPFHEYFHAETGQGLGASHQTGWTGLVADLLLRRTGARDRYDIASLSEPPGYTRLSRWSLRNRVHGTLAAAVTPLTGVDGSIDGDGIGAVVDFYARAGLDGILALGTTGEGVLFSLDERRFAADEFVASAHHRLAVVVHCGAQTTHDTVVLAEHAASHEAAGVAVIPPPYFALDAEAIWRHLDAAAHACAPLPFYVYEFAPRSGYAVPIDVIERLAIHGTKPRRD